MRGAARRRWLAVGAGAVLLATACKPPRSPREVAEGSVAGRWTAQSFAAGAPHDTGSIRWALLLREHGGGRLSGQVARAHGQDTAGFPVAGIRDESSVTLHFDLDGHRVKYHGGIADFRTIAGELFLPRDTLDVTFTRR